MMSWLKKLFSSDGSVSFGRMSAGIVLLASLVWTSYIVWKRLEIPDLKSVALLVTSLYTGSKIGDTVALFSRGDGGNPEIGAKN